MATNKKGTGKTATTTTKAASTKGLDLLKKSKSTNERAEAFYNGIARDLKIDVIDTLTRKKEKLEEERFELEDFTLGTDVNAGMKKMTQDECKAKFARIIEIEYELEMLDLEIESKTAAYEKYFGKL